MNNRIKELILPFLKPTILFESIPDYADNTRAVYDEMVRRGLNRRYYLIWYNKDDQFTVLTKNGEYVLNGKRTIGARMKLLSILRKTRLSILCNRFIEPICPQQKVVFIAHGSPMKSVNGYYTLPDFVDRFFGQGPGFLNMIQRDMEVPKDKLQALGFPRNDVFSKPAIDSRKLFSTDCEKIVAWYPTYRQHKNGFKTSCKNALPLLHDLENAKKLNAIAKELNTLLVLKPHYVQDTTDIKKENFSNIVLIDDTLFAKNGISSYGFLAGCDALVTDYSSVYYDFLLCNKPIGVVWEDIEEYRAFPGFAIDIDYVMKGAEKIYTVEDFRRFLQDLHSGVDRLQAEREEICAFANYSDDGQNTKRVTDAIIRELDCKSYSKA